MPEASRRGKQRALRVAFGTVAALAVVTAACAEECAPEPQGEGRVQAAIDARTLRLEDGRVVRLAGLAALRGPAAEQAKETLASLAEGRTISLHGDSDAPDRYGRQRAWVFAEGQPQSLQAALVAAGGGLRDVGIASLPCRDSLADAESRARNRNLGLWAASQFAKKAETAGDISDEIGHFTIVEGRVRSVRTSGGTTYLNFGRRWRDGFAAIMPRAAAARFEAAGTPAKGLEGRTVRVRGYLVRRGGPRIEVSNPDQIEVDG